MLITAFALYKGGVGKTTTTVNLAVALRDLRLTMQAPAGGRILLIDADAQSGATSLMAPGPPEAIERTVATVVTGDCTLAEAIIRLDDPDNGLDEEGQVAWQGIDLVPSNPDAKVRISGPEDLWCLYDMLREGDLQYDHVLIDCGYGDTDLTTLGLVAADQIVPVVNVATLGKTGLNQLTNKVVGLRRSFPHMVIKGVIANDFAEKEIADRNVWAEYVEELGDLLWQPPVPHRTLIKRSHDARLPVSAFRSPAARELVDIYSKLASQLAAPTHQEVQPA